MNRFFDKFLGKNAATFGEALAEDVSRNYPLPLDNTADAKISVNRISRILEGAYAKAQVYRQEKHLGFFQKSRLCHAFKWRLSDMGYSKPFVDLATEGLVVYINKPLTITPEQAQAQAKRDRKAAKAIQPQGPANIRGPLQEEQGSQPPKFSRSHPSPRYVELTKLYRQMHEEGESFLVIKPEDTFPGLSLPPQAGRIKKLTDATGARRILDYGSGKGQQYLARDVVLPGVPGTWPSVQAYWGVEHIHCYDPAYEPFSELPRGAFDGVISTDVLEHCPEEDMPWILDEIFSYARQFVFANVACYPAKKRLPSGENAHCTIQPKAWWEELVRRTSTRHPGIKYEFWLQWKNAEGNLVEDVIRSM